MAENMEVSGEIFSDAKLLGEFTTQGKNQNFYF